MTVIGINPRLTTERKRQVVEVPMLKACDAPQKRERLPLKEDIRRRASRYAARDEPVPPDKLQSRYITITHTSSSVTAKR